jgi:TolA-binding protein
MNRSWAMTLAVGVLVAAPLVRADSILKGSPGSNPIEQTGVKVTGISPAGLSYMTAVGEPRTVPLTDVQKLAIDGQPGFNAAEDAYAARNFPAALDGYTAALASGSAPDWLRGRAGQRLATVAHVQHRYDAQVAAYAALLAVDPASAAAARPAAPQPNDPYLDAAAANVTRALGLASQSAQRTALLGVQLDIYRARGDKSGVNTTLQQLVAAGGATPAEQAMLKLASADVALDAKQYAQAESAVQQNRALFTDPAQQVDALYVLAQARDGQATGTDALRDVALAYMRVVTFGGELPDHPHVPESLLRAAQIEEKLGDANAAVTLYQQLATDRAYGSSPAAADAHLALDRLKK